MCIKLAALWRQISRANPLAKGKLTARTLLQRSLLLQRRLLIQIKAGCPHNAIRCIMDWNPITSAPFERDIELAVLDQNGEHLVAFACRRGADGWLTARSNRPVDIHPTHWRQWTEKPETAGHARKNGPFAVMAPGALLGSPFTEEALTPDEEVRLLHILE
jgi:hypothetical protein